MARQRDPDLAAGREADRRAGGSIDMPDVTHEHVPCASISAGWMVEHSGSRVNAVVLRSATSPDSES